MRRSSLGAALALVLFAQLPAVSQPAAVCSPQTVVAQHNAEHSSQASLDWQGVYRGVLSQGGEKGQEVTLTLRSDHTYTRVVRAVGKAGADKETRGTFAWAADGNSVMLNEAETGSNRYKVGEGQLWLLDEKGQMFEDPKGTVLVKVGDLESPEVLKTRWSFFELGGGPVEPTSGRRPWLCLEPNGTVQGFAGCNSFRGSYDMQEFLLSFSQLASTKMACPDLALEQKLMEALGKIDRFEVVGSSLFLYDGDELLAQLRAAESAAD